MNGIRAFSRNQGSLNHGGDFELLFSPLLGELAALAVYGIMPGESLYFAADHEPDDHDAPYPAYATINKAESEKRCQDDFLDPLKTILTPLSSGQ